MSWVNEEWKSELPSNALAKISELEDECERLGKEKKCLQFQAESLQATLEKAHVTEDETRKQKQGAERTLAAFLAELDETKESLDKARLTLKEKDVTIMNLTNEVAGAKKERDAEKEKRKKLEAKIADFAKSVCQKDDEIETLKDQLKSSTSKESFSDCSNEQIAKLKAERDLEREEREILETKVEHLEKMKLLQLQEKEEVYRDLQEKIEEFAAKNNFETNEKKELQEMITNLQAQLNDKNAATTSHLQIVESTNEILREENDELEAQCSLTRTESAGVSKQLREEREIFMTKENTLRSEIMDLKDEIEKCKSQRQEEREGFMEQERNMRYEIQQLKRGMRNSQNDSLFNREQSLEAENKDLNETVAVLGSRINDLERLKATLEKENADLTNEIRRERDLCSDVEETMKDDIDSIRSCLQNKIDQLEKRNREFESTLREETRIGSVQLEKQVQELCTELDEVNKILAAERENRKMLEAENFELKKKERRAFETWDGDEKGLLSNLVKKRSEKWNGDVVELKKKVEELEKKNRELMNKLDKKTCSVETIRYGYESKSKDEQLKKGAQCFATPERSGNLSRSSSAHTPLSRGSSKRFDTELVPNSSNHRLENSLRSKEQKIEQLTSKLRSLHEEKENQRINYNARITEFEKEVKILKEQIQGSSTFIAQEASKFVATMANEGGRRVRTGCESSFQCENVKSNEGNTVGELKGLVKEFENESSELQEIIEESKEAIIELKKALQSNEGVFLVESANAKEIKKLAKPPKKDVNDKDIHHHNKSQLSFQETPSEKSYVLSRLSLTDINVNGVLSKLRIAVSQLESRFHKVDDEKKQAQTKLEVLKKDSEHQPRNLTPKSSSEVFKYSNTSSYTDLSQNSSRSAVIEIAKKRDATIIDGTIDDIAHEENIRPRDDKNFQHGLRCKLLWQQLCDAKASISGYEREVNRQKNMYEKHIAECQVNEQQAARGTGNVYNECGVNQEEYEKQEQLILDLQTQLLEEKESSQLLQATMQASCEKFDKTQDKHSQLSEKLEETRSLLHKHNKSSEKKLDSIMNFVQEGLFDQMKELIVAEIRRAELVRASPRELKQQGYQSNSKSSSQNTSFHSPEVNWSAEVVSKKSRSRRGKAIEAQVYKTTAHGYHTIDEIEHLKAKLNGVQENVKGLVASVDQAHREKGKMQEECVRLMQKIEQKEEETKRTETNLELEKRKAKDSMAQHQADKEASEAEQLEVYKEFREMCEEVKRKDVEIINKTKQMKMLIAEWKEKEQSFIMELENLQKENKTIWKENNELRVEVEKSKGVKGEFARKIKSSEEQLGQLYQKLSQVDNLFLQCRQNGLYK